MISDGILYPPIQHYASPRLAARVVALVDPVAAVEYCGSDSVDSQLAVLRRFVPLKIYDFPAFASTHRAFLLYSTNSSMFDWWPARLLHDGYSLSLLNQSGLYLVESPSRPP